MPRQELMLRASKIATLTALGMIAGPAAAQQVGSLIQVTQPTPFSACTRDHVANQVGTNFPNTAIEPSVTVDPKDPAALIIGWQQDRWSNGGSRGLYAAFATNGRSAFTEVQPGPVSKCEGGAYTRASDPWLDFSASGVAYYMHLTFQNDHKNGSFGPNAMEVTRSFDGGKSWGDPTALIVDTDPQVLNDKNSLTVDPKIAPYAYAVWDRLQDFTLPGKGGDPGDTSPTVPGGSAHDGVESARARLQALRAAPAAATQVFFTGPARFSRTTDFGATWEPSKVIYNPGPNAQTINNTVVVTPDGSVLDFFTHITAQGFVKLNLVRSFDHGRTFGSAILAANDAQDGVGVVTPDDQAPVRDAAILSRVAVDPKSGALYLVWQDLRFSGVNEVAFSMSTDGGYNWSSPVKIDQTPANANPLRTQAFIPTIEVGPHGELVVTYYDFRNDVSDGKESTDYWALFCNAAAADCSNPANWGGETRLTDASFDMLNAPIARGHFLGDYMGLKRAGQAVYPVFGMATGVNMTDVFTRKITFGGGALAGQ